MGIWRYLINPFEYVTRGSYKKMEIIAQDHLSKLYARKNIAVIAACYDELKPLLDTFRTTYAHYTSNKGMYKGSSQYVKELFSTLREKKVNEWDVLVQVHFPKYMKQYTMLFPNGKAPFQTGMLEERLTAILTLMETVAHFPELEGLHQNISTFYEEIRANRMEQNALKKAEKTLSLELEKQRILLAQTMHAILGQLISLYRSETEHVEIFYAMKYLKTTPKSKSKKNEEDKME